MFDVAIIGAGPAGLFCAYSLRNSNLKVALLDKGEFVERRNPKETLFGFGGAGAFSDGKLHITPALSHLYLMGKLGNIEYVRYMDEVNAIFTKYKGDATVYPKDYEAFYKLKQEYASKNVELISRKLRHIGTDKLPDIIKDIENELKRKGVELYEKEEVVNITINGSRGVTGVVTKNMQKFFPAKNVVLAPGRSGARWLNKLADKWDIGYSYSPIYIGVRVEVPYPALKEATDNLYEPVLLMESDSFKDRMRTFCICPKGYVGTEAYGAYNCVNGHSNLNNESSNTNFALLSEVKLKEPFSNTLEYGELIALNFHKIGGGKPVLQRYKDLIFGRRTTKGRLNSSYIRPTLDDCVLGDISLGLPHRIVVNLIDAIEKLKKLFPLMQDKDILLYAPEIKMNSVKIGTNDNLETKIKGLYMAGDGAGVSGSIVGAAVSGLMVAKSIKK